MATRANVEIIHEARSGDPRKWNLFFQWVRYHYTDIQTVLIQKWVIDLFGGVLTIVFKRQWGKPEFHVPHFRSSLLQ